MLEATHSVEYLRLVAGLKRANNRPAALRSQEELLLTYGRAFPWRPLPAGVDRGEPRSCFSNAACLALAAPRRYLYCEGYAVNVIPVYHGWCLDREGFVVDPTWTGDLTPEQPEYFGIPFRHAYVWRIAKRPDAFALLDNAAQGWPLCTGKHKIERAIYEIRVVGAGSARAARQA